MELLSHSPPLTILITRRCNTTPAQTNTAPRPPNSIPLLSLQDLRLNDYVTNITTLYRTIQLPPTVRTQLIPYRRSTGNYLNHLHASVELVGKYLRSEGVPRFRSAILGSYQHLDLCFSEKRICPDVFIKEDTEYPLFSIVPSCSGQKDIRRVFTMLFRLLPFGHLESLDADQAMYDYADALVARPNAVPTEFTAATWRRVLSLLPNKMRLSVGVNNAT